MSTIIKTIKAKEINGKIAISSYSHQTNNIKYYVAVCVELTGENQFFGTSQSEAFDELEKSLK